MSFVKNLKLQKGHYIRKNSNVIWFFAHLFVSLTSSNLRFVWKRTEKVSFLFFSLTYLVTLQREDRDIRTTE